MIHLSIYLFVDLCYTEKRGDDMNIGDRIKEHRKKARLTQKQLGELSGTSERTIQQYEGHKRQPRIEQLHKIANALSIPIEDLIGTGNLDLANDVVGLFSDEVQELQNSPEEIALKSSLDYNFTILNIEGKKKVIAFSEDIAKIPEYTEGGNKNGNT